MSLLQDRETNSPIQYTNMTEIEQNKGEDKEYVPNKGTRQNLRRTILNANKQSIQYRVQGNIQMLNELRRMDLNTEFQLRVRKYKKNKSEVKNILSEMKNMLESINSR